jgi:NAD(P)-dependent dehydrogenase (short-subunit alcohol dehydrogenase family)
MTPDQPGPADRNDQTDRTDQTDQTDQYGDPVPGRLAVPPEDDGDGLAGRVAIVTGGGARGEGIGNGRAAAILLARSGARVLVVDRAVELAEATVSTIVAAGGTAEPFAADVSVQADCVAMVERAVALWGRLDVLDNNVGIGSRGSVVDVDPTHWQRVMDVNVTSMVLASRAAIPAMQRSAGGGSIVNVSSISALRPRGLTAYSTSKGAVIALTKAMAVDHGPDGIRVNCVAPGPVYTPMVAGDGMPDASRRLRARASVLGVEGTGWDIGQAVRFLASDRARWITGHVLVVDGGTTLRGPDRDPGTNLA